MLMFLPYELLTLVVLARAVPAFPRMSPLATEYDGQDLLLPEIDPPVNATATISIGQTSEGALETPSDDLNIIPDECLENPRLCGGRERPELPTATGFEDTDVVRTIVGPTTPTNVVRTSSVPQVINVETNTVNRAGATTAARVEPIATPSSAAGGLELEENQAGANVVTQDTSGPSTTTPKEHAGSPAGDIPSRVVLSDAQQAQPAQQTQQTQQNSLLSDIVSRLGQTQSIAQPTATDARPTATDAQPPRPDAQPTGLDAQPAPSLSRGTGDSGEGSTVNSTGDSAVDTVPQTDGDGNSITPGPGMPSATGSTTPGAVPNSITLGSAIITLTPGVSTTIGPSSDQTLVAITTNPAGSTLVTISSSGVAVTATVSAVPTTVTLPKTGFEASITDVARPGVVTSRLSTTSSTAMAVGNKRNEVGWWTSAMLGVVGLALGF
ncbi:hypothetical protein PSV09DRAFT_2423992 [Bipolaris maydis]|nr:hypothetical protein BM1_00465 [Bipolaris maydis]KAJ6207558.1 hypothetical protein PSV09DRAFT_2423992 [Bipolaris maydis]KAJ6280400.1 hypothetical protein J3E71DRAFT_354117 [Bipolaris maydis]